MSLTNEYTDNIFMDESSNLDADLRLLFRAFHYETPCKVFTPTLVVSISVLQKIKIASSNFTCFVTFNIPCQEFWHHCTRTMGTQFFWVQILIPNKNLGYGYKGLVFCRDSSCLIEKHGQGAHCTYQNRRQNDPEFIYPICLPKPKSSGFQ